TDLKFITMLIYKMLNYLKADVISSLNVDSQLQCSHECLTEPGCISFNYRSQTTADTSRQVNCQLSNKTRDEIITEDGQWMFYQDLQTRHYNTFLTNVPLKLFLLKITAIPHRILHSFYQTLKLIDSIKRKSSRFVNSFCITHIVFKLLRLALRFHIFSYRHRVNATPKHVFMMGLLQILFKRTKYLGIRLSLLLIYCCCRLLHENNIHIFERMSVFPLRSNVFNCVNNLRNCFYKFLNAQDLLSSKQFGFRPKYSTTTALSNFADEVLLNMEQGNLCGAVFLDLAKAFDTVDHCILLSKLSAIGVSPSSIKWFESYLSNRKQRTSCGNELSDALPVTVGVPQGSILGPLLFVVYINNLPDAVINSEVTLYADDTVLYYFSKDPRLLEDKLNEDLLRVAHWLRRPFYPIDKKKRFNFAFELGIREESDNEEVENEVLRKEVLSVSEEVRKFTYNANGLRDFCTYSRSFFGKDLGSGCGIFNMFNMLSRAYCRAANACFSLHSKCAGSHVTSRCQGFSQRTILHEYNLFTNWMKKDTFGFIWIQVARKPGRTLAILSLSGKNPLERDKSQIYDKEAANKFTLRNARRFYLSVVEKQFCIGGADQSGAIISANISATFSTVNQGRSLSWFLLARTRAPRDLDSENQEMCILDIYEQTWNKSGGKKKSPWITSQLLRHMHKRDYLKRKATLADDQTLWEEYRVARNRTNNEIRKAKQEYFITHLETAKTNPRKTWKLINELSSPEAFNNHFSNVDQLTL
ncbi:Hypothetical predicted protein, partial [Paramuricea clavata]